MQVTKGNLPSVSPHGTGPNGAHDILSPRRRPLDDFFMPNNVAVIGATDAGGNMGRTIVRNLTNSRFGGTVFAVNPGRSSVLGIPAHASIKEVPAHIDLAVIVTPARTVPGLIGECVDAGVKAAIIISAGFREAGSAGVELETQILAQARRGHLRIIGPNCLGVMSPLTGLNATLAGGMARPGNVAFISQSGALCTAILDWSLRETVGFSAFVSIGSMLDVGWGDLIDYLGDDPHTRSILLYMESIGNARSFLSAAREVALTKPIIVIKAGRTDAGAKAAASHTGSLTGRDQVLDAAFRRSGVLRVYSIADLFYMAEVLAKQPRPMGPRLVIVTNAGGPGVLAADALIANGGELAELSKETIEALNQFLPETWSRNNPIDILGDASPERYAKTVEIAAKDPNSDGVLVILTPKAMTDPTQTAEELKAYAAIPGKPILASWMGGASVAAGEAILSRANVPVFPYPDSAARAFYYMWRFSYNLRGLYETPMLPADSDHGVPDRSRIEQMIQTARQSGRTILSEFESKQLLAAYRIPTAVTRLATSESDAIQLAEEIGYPVVLKLHSHTITHKSDVGGVQLNLSDAAAVRRAYRAIECGVKKKGGPEHFLGVTVQPMREGDGYEIMLGTSIDPQFGPVLLFGAGGQFVEVFKDHALALPPLNSTLARRMMEQTRIYAALKGVGGRTTVDFGALEQLLVCFSQLVIDQRWIKEIDINPLVASGDGLIALDARVVLHDLEISEEQLPKLAIRPYPTRYVVSWTLKDGTLVTLRPIRPEDEPLIVRFHETLSERSVYMRYFRALKLSQRVAHERLTRMCFIDYDREMALVADHIDAKTGAHEIFGVSRLSKLHGTDDAEFAVLVSDRYQNLGLGTELLRRLLEIGRDEKLRFVVGYIHAENQEMRRICEKLGFRIHPEPGEAAVKAIMDLGSAQL